MMIITYIIHTITPGGNQPDMHIRHHIDMHNVYYRSHTNQQTLTKQQTAAFIDHNM